MGGFYGNYLFNYFVYSLIFNVLKFYQYAMSSTYAKLLLHFTHRKNYRGETVSVTSNLPTIAVIM